ncbi:hypothetical protein F5051DRAFT_434549 [Lentinula edodes]|nr:hypothetical protein F5051DRAFT_434549 [Lentinula edodes]KAJ3893315.1 hypothetical protein GG344DRAFT_63836 [Lentinula edodes]
MPCPLLDTPPSPRETPFLSLLLLLDSVITSASFLGYDAFTVFNSFHGVHGLVIKQVEKATLYEAPESERLSVQCVANIITGYSETLETLEIPGEYCPLQNLLQIIQ